MGGAALAVRRNGGRMSREEVVGEIRGEEVVGVRGEEVPESWEMR